MMNKKTILVIAVFQVILITGLYFVLKSGNDSGAENKVVFIENIKVFENFQMKKDYDKMIEKDLMIESVSIDSLGKSVNDIVNSTSMDKKLIEAKKAQYFSAKQAFDNKFAQLSKEYTAQVYERLNIYLKEYGKKKGLKLILGSNGEGNVMYVEKGVDVTEDVISYINNKYLDK